MAIETDNTVSLGDLAGLHRVIQENADHRELAELPVRVGTYLDERRFDDLEALFVEEARVRTPGGSVQGRHAIVAQAARNHTETDVTQHLMGSPLVEIEGDRASIRVPALVTFASARDHADVRRTLGEQYSIQAVRTENGWRIQSLETAPAWATGDVPAPAR